jgi:SAM-dependent methyltransferase
VATEFVFDQPHARRFVEARQTLLRPALKDLQRKLKLLSVADVGCGIGQFSDFLKGLGFKVTGFDGRKENIEEARRRHPTVDFFLANVEDTSIIERGAYDFVLCVGLLYHLENPVRALRNLAVMAKEVLLIESYALPDKDTVFCLREEHAAEDQSLTSLALYPSESSLIKICYKIGFVSVYRFNPLPDHEDFQSSRRRKQQRTMLLASKSPVQLPYLTLVAEPQCYSDPWQTPMAQVLGWRNRFIGRLRSRR